jgi:ABC-type transporter Mla MlaB component
MKTKTRQKEDRTMASADGTENLESPGTHVLKLEGTWTVERANELKQILIEALKGADTLIGDLKYFVEADLSFLQLLCSAHQTCVKLGKNLAWSEEKSKSFKQLVLNAGFKRNMGCERNPNPTGLWIGEWGS